VSPRGDDHRSLDRPGEGSGGGPHGLAVEAATGAAARAGLRAGDRIVAIDAAAPEDVLDLELAAAEGRFSLEVEHGGRRRTLEVVCGRGEEHGVELRDVLGVPVRRCANDCTFCFIDQVPPGLRPSLLVKDDDYRLSFLQGTFVTLTNLDDRDVSRIVRLQLSPLYVSLHAWDDDVRVALMGPCAVGARERLEELVRGGVSLHLQIVLCPGVNDGAVLEESVRRLAEVAVTSDDADGNGGVVDVGVVPVSLARERPGLQRVRATDARAAVALVETLQDLLVARLGRRFVHAADELYLQTGELPPAGDAPEQYENGVGICAATLAEVETVRPPDGVALALLGGRAAAPVLDAACRRLEARTGAAARPFVVDNALFGPYVTVTGLLGGREVVERLDEQPLAAGEWLLAPRTWLPVALGRTLDDVTEGELAAACGGRLALGHDLNEAMAACRRAAAAT